MIDPDSRRWGAGHWGDHMRAELVGDALLAAFGNGRPPKGVIFRSDRGSPAVRR